MRIRVVAILAAVALAALALSPGASGRTEPAVGQGTFVNFEHIYTYGPDEGFMGASDIDFFTTKVRVKSKKGKSKTENRDFVVVGGYPQGDAIILDITDPENVQFATRITCQQSQNSPDVKKIKGRWILVLPRDGGGVPCVVQPLFGLGGGGLSVFDVTDPYNVKPLFGFLNQGSAHNFTFHPTKPFGWISTGDLPGGLNHIPIVDFRNMKKPVLANDIDVEGGPHDITFSADGNRAYVASENNYRLYDTTDPDDPVLLSTVPNPGTYAHGWDPTPDGTIAVATNESLALGGFFTPGALCPGEGLTFYDVTNEALPTPVGQYFADMVGPTTSGIACTGHVGKIAENSHILVWGWYGAGVRVVDLADPSAPTEIGSAVLPGTEVWAAKFYKGPYVYTGDIQRGFDVFKWTGPLPAPWEAD